jgi:hypothetical protein
MFRVTYRRGVRPQDRRDRVEVTDVAAFRAALGDRLAMEFMKALAGVDLLFGLHDAGTRVGDEEGARPHHTRLTLATLSFGVLVELASYLDTLPIAMRSKGLDLPVLDEIDEIARRWREKARRPLRTSISFHFDEETMRRGLDQLAQKTGPLMLIEERGGLPCFEAGGRALFMGLTGLPDDGAALLTEMAEDIGKLGHAMRAVLSRIVEAHRHEADFVEDKPLIMR